MFFNLHNGFLVGLGDKEYDDESTQSHHLDRIYNDYSPTKALFVVSFVLLHRSEKQRNYTIKGGFILRETGGKSMKVYTILSPKKM